MVCLTSMASVFIGCPVTLWTASMMFVGVLDYRGLYPRPIFFFSLFLPTPRSFVLHSWVHSILLPNCYLRLTLPSYLVVTKTVRVTITLTRSIAEMQYCSRSASYDRPHKEITFSQNLGSAWSSTASKGF